MERSVWREAADEPDSVRVQLPGDGVTFRQLEAVLFGQGWGYVGRDPLPRDADPLIERLRAPVGGGLLKVRPEAALSLGRRYGAIEAYGASDGYWSGPGYSLYFAPLWAAVLTLIEWCWAQAARVSRMPERVAAAFERAERDPVFVDALDAVVRLAGLPLVDNLRPAHRFLMAEVKLQGPRARRAS